MSNRFRTYVSSLLLACFSVFIIPNELVHALYGHDDTKHEAVAGASRSIGEQHIHCAFLTYEAPSFYQAADIITPAPAAVKYEFAVAETKSDYTSSSFYSYLRGPPAC